MSCHLRKTCDEKTSRPSRMASLIELRSKCLICSRRYIDDAIALSRTSLSSWRLVSAAAFIAEQNLVRKSHASASSVLMSRYVEFQ